MVGQAPLPGWGFQKGKSEELCDGGLQPVGVMGSGEGERAGEGALLGGSLGGVTQAREAIGVTGTNRQMWKEGWTVECDQ